jgi:hypothetical protein
VCLGDAKVEQLNGGLNRDENVVRLDVAMNDADAMCRAQPIDDTLR